MCVGVWACVCLCACVCVWERDREKGRDRKCTVAQFELFRSPPMKQPSFWGCRGDRSDRQADCEAVTNTSASSVASLEYSSRTRAIWFCVIMTCYTRAKLCLSRMYEFSSPFSGFPSLHSLQCSAYQMLLYGQTTLTSHPFWPIQKPCFHFRMFIRIALNTNSSFKPLALHLQWCGLVSSSYPEMELNLEWQNRWGFHKIV